MKQSKQTFNEYYESFFKQRWPNLLHSLSQNNKQVIRPCFSNIDFNAETIFSLNAYEAEPKQQENNETLNEYIMDPASILAASCLEIRPDNFVLDMCASPGGKSLVLLESLSKGGELWANEISQARRVKLKSVIKKHVPLDRQNLIYIKGRDATQYGIKFPNTFDKILVDAPCSGERHLLHSPTELAKWSSKRTKRLAQTQYSMLCSALLACKEGGQIVYSTCSISPQENDLVIEKLMNKKSESFELDLPAIEHKYVERTKYGFQILPDNGGFGPLYFSRLKKKKL